VQALCVRPNAENEADAPVISGYRKGPAQVICENSVWENIDSCFPGAEEALSTRCGGQGITVFYGMAKPVHAPQIGPARAP
jgi:hypothetical protein